MVPVAGLDPATHVFERGCVDRRKGVDDRDKPGQGDLGLFQHRYKQPVFLNRTAVWLSPAKGIVGCPEAALR